MKIRNIIAVVLLLVIAVLGAYGVMLTKDLPQSREDLNEQMQARTPIIAVSTDSYR